jgi:hypothetical protein
MKYKIRFYNTQRRDQQNSLNRLIRKQLQNDIRTTYIETAGPSGCMEITFPSVQDYTFFCMHWNTDNVEFYRFVPLGVVRS